MTRPQSAVYSADGKHAYVFGNGPTQAINLATGETTFPQLSGPGMAISTAGDGKNLVVAGSDPIRPGVVNVWRLETNQPVATIQTGDTNISAAVFTPDGRSLAIASQTNGPSKIHLYSLSTGKVEQTIHAGENYVTQIIMSKGGSVLADLTIGASGKFFVEVWDLKSGKRTQNIGPTSYAYGPSFTFSPDGSALAISGGSQAGNSLTAWNVTTGKQNWIYTEGPAGGPIQASFTPSGSQLVVSGASYGPLQLWDASTGAKIAALPTKAYVYVASTAFSPDGKSLIDTGLGYDLGYTAPIEFWNLATLHLDKVSDAAAFDTTTAATFSPDGKLVATGGISHVDKVTQVINLWKAASGAAVATFDTSVTGNINSVAFSPDGKLLAVGGGSVPGSENGTGGLEIWDVATGTRKAILNTAASSGVANVMFTPDGKALVDAGQASGTGPLFELWNVATLKSLGNYPVASTGFLSSAALTPDGKRLIVGGTANAQSLTASFLQVRNVATGELILTLPTGAKTVIQSVACSPDGNSLASTGMLSVYYPPYGGYTIPVLEVWNAGSGKQVGSFGSNFPIYTTRGVSYSSDSKNLFAGVYSGIGAFDLNDYSWLWGGSFGPSPTIVTSPRGSLICCFDTNGAVYVAENPLNSEPLLGDVSVSPSPVPCDSITTGTVTLLRPAPPGGTVVTLSTISGFATTPPSIVIPAGNIVGKFTIRTLTPYVECSETIMATVEGGKRFASLTIEPPPVVSAKFSTPSVKGGESATLTITIGAKAPPNGITISLSWTPPLNLNTYYVEVPGGKSSVSVTIPTPKVAKKTTVSVTATLKPTSKTATLVID